MILASVPLMMLAAKAGLWSHYLLMLVVSAIQVGFLLALASMGVTFL